MQQPFINGQIYSDPQANYSYNQIVICVFIYTYHSTHHLLLLLLSNSIIIQPTYIILTILTLKPRLDIAPILSKTKT